MPSPATCISRPVCVIQDEAMDVAGDAEGEGEALHRSNSAPELRVLLDPAVATAYNPAMQVLQHQSSSALPSVSSTSGALVPYRNAQVCLVSSGRAAPRMRLLCAPFLCRGCFSEGRRTLYYHDLRMTTLQEVLRDGVYREMHRQLQEHQRRLEPSCVIEELPEDGDDDMMQE